MLYSVRGWDRCADLNRYSGVANGVGASTKPVIGGIGVVNIITSLAFLVFTHLLIVYNV